MSGLDDLIPDDHPAVAAPPPPKPATGLDALIPDDHKDAVEPPSEDRKYRADPLQIARVSLATTPEQHIKRYAESFKQPVSDFIRDNDGEILRKVPETGQYAYVEPHGEAHGLGDRVARGADWVASGAGPAIPAATGTLGAAGAALLGRKAGPKAGLAAGVAGGAAGAAVGEMGREKADRWLADDDEPMDWGNVGWQAAAGATYEPAGLALKAAGKAIAPIFELQPEAKAAVQRFAQKIPGFSTWMAKGAPPAATVAAEGTADHVDNPLNLTETQLKAINEHLTAKQQDLAQSAQDAKDLGITTSLGQKTQSEDIQSMEADLASTPEGRQRMANLRATQNTEQVPGAITKTLDNISPWRPDERGQAVAAFREGAVAAKDKAATDLNAKARVAFKGALDDKDAAGDRFWSPDIDNLFQRPSMQRSLSYARALAAEKGDKSVLNIPTFENGKRVGDDVVPTWRGYEWIRKAMRAQLEDPANQNPATGKLNTMGNQIKQTYDQFMGTLLKKNPEWGEALTQYGTDAHDMNLVFRGGIKKLADMDKQDTLSMVNSVFSGGQSNPLPEDIREMRAAFEKADRLPEWYAGFRGYAQNMLDKALDPTQAGRVGNTAGKFMDAFDDPNKQEVIKAALGDPAKFARWQKLMSALKSARQMVPEGSPTTGRSLRLEQYNPPGTSLAAKAIGAARIISHPRSEAASAALEFADKHAALKASQNRAKAVDFLLSDDGDKQLAALVGRLPTSVKPGTVAAQRQFDLLNSFLGAAGVSAATPSDDKQEQHARGGPIEEPRPHFARGGAVATEPKKAAPAEVEDPTAAKLDKIITLLEKLAQRSNGSVEIIAAIREIDTRDGLKELSAKIGQLDPDRSSSTFETVATGLSRAISELARRMSAKRMLIKDEDGTTIGSKLEDQ